MPTATIWAAALALPLVLGTTLLHYEVLRGMSRGLPRLNIAPRKRLVFVIMGGFFAHLAQIGLYGLAYWMLGRIPGEHGWNLATSLYASAQIFTSLGLGDIEPPHVLWPLVGVQTVNGLLLIAWTASYTYLAMERYWKAPERG